MPPDLQAYVTIARPPFSFDNVPQKPKLPFGTARDEQKLRFLGSFCFGFHRKRSCAAGGRKTWNCRRLWRRKLRNRIGRAIQMAAVAGLAALVSAIAQIIEKASK